MFGLFWITFGNAHEHWLLIGVADNTTALDDYYDNNLKDFPLIDTVQTHVEYCEKFQPHYYYKPIKDLS